MTYNLPYKKGPDRKTVYFQERSVEVVALRVAAKEIRRGMSCLKRWWQRGITPPPILQPGPEGYYLLPEELEVYKRLVAEEHMDPWHKLKGTDFSVRMWGELMNVRRNLGLAVTPRPGADGAHVPKRLMR